MSKREPHRPPAKAVPKPLTAKQVLARVRRQLTKGDYNGDFAGACLTLVREALGIK